MGIDYLIDLDCDVGCNRSIGYPCEDDEDDAVRKVTVEVESNNGHQMIEFLNTLAFAAGQKLDVLIDG